MNNRRFSIVPILGTMYTVPVLRINMSFFAKTFGGLSKSYQMRNIFFGLFFLLLSILMGYLIYIKSGIISGILTFSIYGIICLLLYPYSRFIYKSVISYMLENNTFFVNNSVFIYTKLITMGICFFLSIAIAPIGLIYLYFYQSKQENTN